MQKATFVHIHFVEPVKDSAGNVFNDAQFHDVYAGKGWPVSM